METALHIAILSNIVFEPYFLPLMKYHFGDHMTISPIPYGEHTATEYQAKLADTNLIVVWLSLEALLPDRFYVKTGSDYEEFSLKLQVLQ